MKKNLLASILFSILVFSLSAQTNLNFETWTGNNPDGWITYNALMQLGAPQSTFKETADPGESLSSAKMVTIACTICPNFGLPTTLGGVVTGGLAGPPPSIGVPYTGRPTSVDFQYKANPMAGDAGIMFVQVSRWDAGTAKKVVIGQGYLLANAAVTSWTSQNLPIQYANADVPDTLMILATSSAGSAIQGLPNSGTPATGSEFYVDSIVIHDPCANSNIAVTVTGTNETVAGANDGSVSAVASGYDGQVKTVQVASFMFTPNSFNVFTSDTVEWVWMNGSHTTTSVSVPTGAATWDSPMNSTNTSFKYFVSEAGSYSFKCKPHAGSGMTGSFTATSPYTFGWSNLSTSESQTGLAPGTYSVIVADTGGCLAAGSYTITAGPAGINSPNVSENITVYPKPATSTLFFKIPVGIPGEILITDIAGKTILTKTISKDLTTVSVESFSEGIYFYQIRNSISGKINSGKFAVVK